jgi:uncharacterized coiled-coil protein SlyX
LLVPLKILRFPSPLLFLASVGFLLAPVVVWADGTEVSAAQLDTLLQQNRSLQAQLQAQQQTIDALNARLSSLDEASARQAQALQGLRERLDAPAAGAPAVPASSSSDNEIRISGEAGLGFFNSGAQGQYPNGDFRLDEARVFVDAPVWKNVFLHTEIDLRTREATDDDVYTGELYADFENVSGLWGADDLLTVRVGRFYIPFGEEYQHRMVLDDPLISHSASDIWGLDQGVEIYGKRGELSYVVAVQDGGINSIHDFNPDKSVAGRIGFDPAPWLHLSGSAMRTGRLSSSGDQLSALWFDQGFIRSLGAATTTNEFDATLLEVDGSVHAGGGSLAAAGGTVRFDDNNRTRNDSRHLTYYYIEATQQLDEQLLAAVRFSHISAPGGYPLGGQGGLSTFFFGGISTTTLNRLSLGLDYRFGPPLVLKLEYSPEWGQTLTGQTRDHENLLSSEVGVKF